MSDDDGFVAPAEGHELTKERDFQLIRWLQRAAVITAQPAAQVVSEVEIPIHFLIFDEGSAENDLRDQDERDDIDGGLAFAHQAGDEQTEHHPGERTEEHPEEIIPEHGFDFQHGISDEQVDGALGGSEDSQGSGFGQHVIAAANVVIPLALEQHLIADDIIGAIGQSQKHTDHQRHEEVGGNMKGTGKSVHAVLAVPQDKGDQQRQQGGFQQGSRQIAPVAQLGDEGAAKDGRSLSRLVPPPSARPRRDPRRRSRHHVARDKLVRLAHPAASLLKNPPRLKAIAPKSRTEPPPRRQTAVLILRVNHIATEIPQRRLHHIKNHLGRRRPLARNQGIIKRHILLDRGLPKIPQHGRRRTVKGQPPPPVQQQRLIKQAEQARTGLVNTDKNHLVVR